MSICHVHADCSLVLCCFAVMKLWLGKNKTHDFSLISMGFFLFSDHTYFALLFVKVCSYKGNVDAVAKS